MLKWASKFEIKPGVWVFIPTDEEIQFGRSLKKELETFWSPPSYYYHLRKGGHIAALKYHVGNSYFLRLDLTNFFGCIGRSRVTRNLKRFYQYKTAREYANRSTVRHPERNPVVYMIPFGFVQSPLIASICLQSSKLGGLLGRLNASKEFDVSVYVDDILVSSKSHHALTTVEEEIRESAENSGFYLNLEKSTSTSDEVTAFNVVLSSNGLRVSDQRLEQFFDALRASDNEFKIEGILNYIRAVNSEQCLKLADEIEKIRPGG